MKLKYISSILLGSLLAFSSCDVERDPYNAIPGDKAFASVEAAGNWNNGIYSELRENSYGIFMFSTDVQADLLNATREYGNRNGAPHRWNNAFNSGDYTIRDVWRYQYSALKDINFMLEGFKTVPTNTESEKATMARYTAEAHFARALYFHNLVVRFAKMYDPASAAQDLGIPLLLNWDINDKPSRSSVKETYDQILKDLEAARAGLANVKGSPGAFRFTIEAVNALENRVRLYMQDWKGAQAIGETLIESGLYKLYTSEDGVKEMWHNDKAGEDILTMTVVKPSEMPNTNNIYLGYNATKAVYTPDFVPTKRVLDLYDDTDFRKAAYFLKDKIQIQGIDYTNEYMVNKYPGNPELWTATVTNYAHKPKVFRVAEVYLNTAEAAFRNGKPDVAIKYLNAIRVARGLSGLNVSGDALMDAIKEERLRELAFEGFRLDDLRRWKEGFTRGEPQNINFIVVAPATEFHMIDVKANDLKFTWGIPSNDITINPNLAGSQNEGW